MAVDRPGASALARRHDARCSRATSAIDELLSAARRDRAGDIVGCLDLRPTYAPELLGKARHGCSLSANITETPATFGISVGRWR